MSIGLTAIRNYLHLHFAGHDIPALLGHLETAIGEKVTEAVGGVQLVIDDLKRELGGLEGLKASVAELEQKVAHPLVAVDPVDPVAKLEELVNAEFAKLTAGIDDRLTTMFEELLAKAAASEQPPATAPVAELAAPQA